MFFVFGSPRSGTTLLAQILNAHPDVVVPGETNFIVPAAYICERVKNSAVGKAMIASLIGETSLFDWGIGQYITADEAREAVLASEYDLGAILRAVYAAVATSANKKIAGDKSPNDLNHAALIQTTGGIQTGTKIIHIVRDVRDVGASIITLNWFERREMFDATHAHGWCSGNMGLYLRMRGTRDYFFLRYEDFVRSPGESCRSLCDFLQVEFQPRMLDVDRREPRYGQMDCHAKVLTEISDDKIGSHRSLPRELLARWTSEAKDALSVFGYS